jgi:hypothetical protein
VSSTMNRLSHAAVQAGFGNNVFSDSMRLCDFGRLSKSQELVVRYLGDITLFLLPDAHYDVSQLTVKQNVAGNWTRSTLTHSCGLASVGGYLKSDDSA